MRIDGKRPAVRAIKPTAGQRRRRNENEKDYLYYTDQLLRVIASEYKDFVTRLFYYQYR